MHLSSFRCWLAAALLTPCTLGLSQIVTVSFEATVSRIWSDVTFSYTEIAPLHGTGSITLDLSQVSILEAGQSTITYFGAPLGAAWVSPMRSLVPKDANAGAYGAFNLSRGFASTADFQGAFYTGFGFEAYAHSPTDNPGAAYSIELRFQERSPQQAGNGTSDHPFSADEFVAMLIDAKERSLPFIFSEEYTEYRILNEPAFDFVRDTSGSWSDKNARITSVVVNGLPAVPEPTAYGCVGTLCLLVLAIHRKAKGAA